MLTPKIECLYKPSFSKGILRTAGLFFVSGYAAGAMFGAIAFSKRNYGQFVANRMCLCGLVAQFVRRAVYAIAVRTD
ncbi:hypothetical protein M896_060590 [Ordospora colligata OC4]|uniref:Uncharacterized protein n=1 Tax=Ordospora colligata OC4 TaxID=1354746 RepID=A0A0B2UKM3_9MICR|nr:uncharacterized protein M896_060590 [Ordospora colligata OC4]KHN69560.1 hypothetical protein M896_060590 [Ordospora colligata OC4]